MFQNVLCDVEIQWICPSFVSDPSECDIIVREQNRIGVFVLFEFTVNATRNVSVEDNDVLKIIWIFINCLLWASEIIHMFSDSFTFRSWNYQRKTHFCLHSLLSSVHLNWHLHKRCGCTNLRGLSAESQSICSFSIRAANSIAWNWWVCLLFLRNCSWLMQCESCHTRKLRFPLLRSDRVFHNSMRFLQVHITDITVAMNMKSAAWKSTKIIFFWSDTESHSYTNRTRMRLRPISEASSSCARWIFLIFFLCSLGRWWLKIRIRFACFHWTMSWTTEENLQIIFWRTHAHIVRVEMWLYLRWLHIVWTWYLSLTTAKI